VAASRGIPPDLVTQDRSGATRRARLTIAQCPGTVVRCCPVVVSQVRAVSWSDAVAGMAAADGPDAEDALAALFANLSEATRVGG
jgi:hypothetical protein